MVIKYKDKEITTLEDIQKRTVKELRPLIIAQLRLGFPKDQS